MNVLSIRELGEATHLGALYGSAVACLTFAIGFSTEQYLPDMIKGFFTGNTAGLDLATYIALIAAVFISYLLAAKKGYAILGSVLATGFVVAIFACCQVSHDFYPSTSLLVMICPALLHVLAGQFYRLSPESEVSSQHEEAINLVGTPQVA